ncbi:uncharacterized protein [Nicotiana tomentosiformis]|uniref:uncharacterized protein n=1 Tax=Nicotiana tomentosiformis TaxID=4098 RepID=UPI00388C6D39
MGIVESSRVGFTTFQLKGAAYQWWRAYELGSPIEAASLTWTQFSDMFLRKFVSLESQKSLVATVRERVRRFIEGLNPGIRFNIAQELEMDIAYQQVVEIAMRLEGMWAREREEREAKRPRDSITYSGARAPVAAHQSRGYVSRLVHSALLASSGILATPTPQAPYYAPPLSSAPPGRGAFSGQSSRLGPSQPQQQHPSSAYFECGDTHQIVRDCPKLRRGAPPSTTQAPSIPPGS